MEWLLYLVAVVFMLAGIVCVLLVVLGLPGTWIYLALAVIIELADSLYLPDDRARTFNYWILGMCLTLAIVGEILEFYAGMYGAKKGGSTRRGIIGSLIGGIVGAIVLTPIIPVPVIGSLIGAVIGTFAGAVIGELTGPDGTVRAAMKPATGASIGRVLGTLSKLPIAVIVWITLSVDAFWA